MISMKFFLSMCGLVLCVGLSLSRVSPEFHSLFFHFNEACPHAEGTSPCHSHEDEEDKQGDEQSSCPVLLFSKSYQFSLAPVFLPQPALSVVQVFLEEPDGFCFVRTATSIWARGPPLSV